jgi:hypothetical protein
VGKIISRGEFCFSKETSDFYLFGMMRSAVEQVVTQRLDKIENLTARLRCNQNHKALSVGEALIF